MLARGVACLIGLVAAVAAGADAGALAASPDQTGARGNPSGLPIPRFVSLKASRVNVRIGPGENYEIAWVFTRPGLPIEIIQEFDNWRRIRDSDGTVGWVFHSLLSGKRTAVVAPWSDGDLQPIRVSASPQAAVSAYVESGVLAEIKYCDTGWCRLSGNKFDGWIAQDQLWGVYPDEEIN